MKGFYSRVAKAVVTEVERKVDIYHTIKRKGLNAMQKKKKYQVSRSTAFHWLKQSKDAKDATFFVKKVERPPLLSDREVLEAKATVDEMTRNSNPLNAALYTENVRNARELLNELVEEQNKSKLINETVILTPKMLYNQMRRRLKLKQMSVETKTEARLSAINDARNAISMLIAAMMISNVVSHVGLSLMAMRRALSTKQSTGPITRRKSGRTGKWCWR